MAAHMDLYVIPATAYNFNFWWPLVGVGYYNFSAGGLAAIIRDVNDVVVLVLGSTPTTNGSYFKRGVGDFSAANGQLIPEGCWGTMYLAPLDSADLNLHTYNWSCWYVDGATTPPTKFSLLRGQVYFINQTAPVLSIPQL